MHIVKKVLAVFLAALFVMPGLGIGMTALAVDRALSGNNGVQTGALSKAICFVTDGEADCITRVSAYGSAETKDRIFALSRNDATNADYGFIAEINAADTARQACDSDYAKCQGLSVDKTSKLSAWYLRTAPSASN
ncbi:MAG: hypothetical protein K6B52_00430 [Clostridiales bacterium]|nr:hypothetical protein [Clostridiales bacterium]